MSTFSTHYTINAVSFYYSWYGAIHKRQYTDKTLTLRKCMCMRASEASELRKFRYFYILKLLFSVGTSDALSVQMTCLSAYMYRQISQCTDKFPNVPTKVRKDIIGGAIAPPAPPLATLMPRRYCTVRPRPVESCWKGAINEHNKATAPLQPSTEHSILQTSPRRAAPARRPPPPPDDISNDEGIVGL